MLDLEVLYDEEYFKHLENMAAAAKVLWNIGLAEGWTAIDFLWTRLRELAAYEEKPNDGGLR